MELDEKRLEELNRLSARLGYAFRDLDLLSEALTHRSYANERLDQPVKDNERMEFLGDSVLDLIVSRYLVFLGQDLREGELSKIRSQVVNETSLARFARELELGEFLLLGRGEESSGGRDKNSILANAFEAIIAAIYLDSSFDEAYHVILCLLKCELDETTHRGPVSDYKGQLQKLIKARNGSNPQYRLIEETGPDHEKMFKVQAMISGTPAGVGVGRTKKEAEQAAAREACEKFATESPGTNGASSSN